VRENEQIDERQPKPVMNLRQLADAAAVSYQTLYSRFTRGDLVPDFVDGKGAPLFHPVRALEITMTKPVFDLGHAFVRSPEYRAWRQHANIDGRPVDRMRVEMPAYAVFDAFQLNHEGKIERATLTTSGLTNIGRPESSVVEFGREKLWLSMLIPSLPCSAGIARFTRETSFTNGAAAVAEGGQKPEASFALEEADVAIKKIAVTATVTDELIQDHPSVAQYLNNSLGYSVLAREEELIISGSGSGAEFTGILNTSGIQTESIGGSATPLDAVHKAITKIRVNAQCEPTAIVFHPNDWQDIRLSKDGAGQYYGGGPLVGPYGQPLSPSNTLWGLSVVVTTHMTEGTAIVADFARALGMFRRQGVTIEATNSHNDDFQYNRTTIRAEERCALAVFRPAGVCTVTGL
jgi:hypothetical protein